MKANEGQSASSLIHLFCLSQHVHLFVHSFLGSGPESLEGPGRGGRGAGAWKDGTDVRTDGRKFPRCFIGYRTLRAQNEWAGASITQGRVHR